MEKTSYDGTIRLNNGKDEVYIYMIYEFIVEV
jgi:hypothetical protein